MNRGDKPVKLGQIGEFGLIDMIRGRFCPPADVVGIGDDCAVIPQRQGLDTLVSTDMLIEGTHFILGRISPYCLGWKSAAVNISDIAAMGGRPTGSFLSLALPDKLDCEWASEFIRGYWALSSKYAAPLLGGDTTSSRELLCINVAVVGECESGRAVRRSAARVGDLVCVTGPLGDSAAGLRMLLQGETDTSNALIRAHCLPEPQVDKGLLLSSMEGMGAMMDISDGIGSDLEHILKESSVGARIDVQAVPLSEQLIRQCRRWGADPLDFALSGGEDYQLLFTCRKDAAIPISHYVIGEITSSGQLEWAGTQKKYTGYRHF